MIRCQLCRRVGVKGGFRLPWPGEAVETAREGFCPACAEDTLARLRGGERVYDRLRTLAAARKPRPLRLSVPRARVRPQPRPPA